MGKINHSSSMREDDVVVELQVLQGTTKQLVSLCAESSLTMKTIW